MVPLYQCIKSKGKSSTWLLFEKGILFCFAQGQIVHWWKERFLELMFARLGTNSCKNSILETDECPSL